ncbi:MULTISPECIES: phosphatase PAP2 family protein [unclassified Paraburkholderia]|uniref:phosphatase PAP2 family protein n=1 Tax=unclassified Paraburkholderia TaxID=2615204 RepID=UPI001801DBEE|nr:MULTISPECIES: phosphatase PAP2 family protein [unclassified Paraburkholderia]MBB5445775.1 hypothetical protein [Paraburkholderia sp. WSM4177]MBB5486173.1 hypothetical protein [Paraburkholderia sp. WSM4180]
MALVTAFDWFWVAGKGYIVPGDGVANLAQAGARHGVDAFISHDARYCLHLCAASHATALLIAIPLNVTMILSTPTQGGHYLADVFAGLLLSALTIAALKRCMHLLATRKSTNAPSSRSMPMQTA